MQLTLTAERAFLTATLLDAPTARDFASLLPLPLTLTDYAHTEKVSDLPRRLSTESAPAGSEGPTGTLAYYAPWGNLAIFTRDFGFASGLIPLGHFDTGIEALHSLGAVRVTLSLR